MKTLKTIGNSILFFLSFIWQLPQSVLGLFFLLYFWLRKDLHLISYKKLCFAFYSRYMPGGISLGNFAFVSTSSAKSTAIVMHEQEGHTVDSKIWGPLYLLVIGLPSILWAQYGDDNKCYYSFYTERWANNHAGLEAYVAPSGRCYLIIKKK
jgi:hypothetical protein